MTRVVDAKKIEEEYIKEKIEYNAEYIGIKNFNAFPMNKVIALLIKCAYSFNYYGMRDEKINKGMINGDYPRCDQLEYWEHVIKFKDTKEIYRIFIAKLYSKILDK